MIPNRKQARKIIDQVRRLPQDDDVWQATMRRVRTWIKRKNKPSYRPYVVMIISTNKARIVRTHLIEEPLSAKELFFELLQAMRRPMWFSGGKRRPTIIHLDHDEHAKELAPQLQKLNIRLLYRHSLPMIKQAMHEMEKQMNKVELLPGLLSLPRISPPLVGYLYQQAKEFYELTPWCWLNDKHPIEIRYPVNTRPRYAIVMGSGGTVFGLAIYDSLEGLRQILSPSTSKEFKSPPTFALYFDKAQAVAFDDLDALELYNWPIAGKQAYPIFARTKSDEQFQLPQAKDLFWAEGALAGVVGYLRDYMQLQKPYHIQPIEIEIPVTTISGEKQVYLRLPVNLDL